MRVFAISDIHGYYDAMKHALDEAGFDENNEEHWLVVCGDCWDRGDKPTEVMSYLLSLPRKVLVRGNHEDLFVECCERGAALLHDYSNGTYDIICKLGKTGGYDFEECCTRALARSHVFLDSMVDYFETKNYIFVHSWVPLICGDDLPKHYVKNRKFEFDPNWRNANARAWDIARWGNPFALAEQGLNQTGKTIVFGHWHCSTGWAKDENRSEFGDDAKFDPYYGNGFIAIDACTAHSGKCNIIVIEDEVE